MARKEQASSSTEPKFGAAALVHPVYLDVPMLISFVAAVEGGVSFEDQATSRQASISTNEAEASARTGLPSLLSLLTLDLSGRLRHQGQAEASEEVTVVRRHTEASLFNLLRGRLHDEGVVTAVSAADDIPELQPGDIVELTGEVVGNPLQQLLDLLGRIAPYLGLDLSQLDKPAKPARNRQAGRGKGKGGQQSGQQTQAADEIDGLDDLRMAMTMQQDLASSAVRDVVLKADGRLRAVLTLSTEFFDDAAQEHMLGSRLRVLGKVTRVIETEGNINLMRRTALGLMKGDNLRQMVSGFTDEASEDLDVNVGDPLVEAPALQVLPLAVFV